MNEQIQYLINSLNEKQKEAVLTEKQNVKILAGAGSGKTKVLTTRIAYLLSLGVSGKSILAVTFTNKAAKEMKERIKKIIPDDKINELKDIWIGTFHGLCNRIISEHHQLLNLPKNYEIVDSNDQKSLIKRVLEEMQIKDLKEVLADSQNFINLAKENGFRPEANSLKLMALKFSSGTIVLDVYKRYEELRKISNILDFGDLLLYVVELFSQNQKVNNFYNQKFQHILVDEYQDTNNLQEEWLKFISKNNYFYVVGDDDQSIYGWRGAQIDNIINFEKRYNDSEVIKLEQNYRSTNNILMAANAVIDKNKKRTGKNLWSEKDEGKKIFVVQAYNPEEEAKLIASKIETEIRKFSRKPSDFAILYRNNSISRTFESKLTEKKIPYKIVGGVGFWSRSEIKDVISYLSMYNNPDNDISFERSVNFPTRGVGAKMLEIIRDNAATKKISLYTSLKELIENKTIKDKTGRLKEYIDLIEFGNINKDHKVKYILNDLFEKVNFNEEYSKSKEGDDKIEERLSNLQELVFFAKDFKHEEENRLDLEAFLYYASLQSDADKDQSIDSVLLLTVHASKGLEFPVVFIVGMEQGIFPSQRSIDNSELEEERRLAYVAITRAMEELTISFSCSRYGKEITSSKFLNEIPISILDTENEEGWGNTQIVREILKDKALNRQSKKIDKLLTNLKYKVGDTLMHKEYGKGTVQSIFIKDEKIIASVSFFTKKVNLEIGKI